MWELTALSSTLSGNLEQPTRKRRVASLLCAPPIPRVHLNSQTPPVRSEASRAFIILEAKRVRGAPLPLDVHRRLVGSFETAADETCTLPAGHLHLIRLRTA